MPVVTVYRSRRSLGRELRAGRWWMRWDEASWEPRPPLSLGWEGWAHDRAASEPVAVRVPPGATLADRPTSDGRTVRRLVRGDDGGIDAAAVLWLAERGEGGFRVEDTDMARRRRDEGIDLFAGLHDEPTEKINPIFPATIADQADHFRSACERALAQLRKGLEDPEAGCHATARAILEEALEGAA